MEEKPDTSDILAQAETYCEKRQMRSPDCADCEVAVKEDFEEKMKEVAAPLQLEITSIMFRLFHPAHNTKAYWRTRLCGHFREIIKPG